MRSERPSRSRLRTILELAAGLVLFALLLASVEGERLLEALRQANPGLAVAGIGWFFVMVGIDAWRMKIAFGRYRLSYRRSAEIQAAGFFVSNFTPGMAGADILRVGVAHRIEAGLSAPIALALLLRLLGMVVLIGASALWMLLFPERLTLLEERLALGDRVGAISVEAVVLVTVLAFALLGLALWSGRLRQLVRAARQVVTELGLRGLTTLVGGTLLMVVAGALSLFFLARSVGVDASPPDMLLVLALLTVGSLIPLGPGGLGLREGAISGGFVAFGAPLANALAAALLHRASFWAVSLVGWAVVVKWRRIGLR